MLEQLNSKQGELNNIIYTLTSVFGLPSSHRSIKATGNVRENLQQTFESVNKLAAVVYAKSQHPKVPQPQSKPHQYDKEYSATNAYQGPAPTPGFRVVPPTHDSRAHYPQNTQTQFRTYGSFSGFDSEHATTSSNAHHHQYNPPPPGGGDPGRNPGGHENSGGAGGPPYPPPPPGDGGGAQGGNGNNGDDGDDSNDNRRGYHPPSGSDDPFNPQPPGGGGGHGQRGPRGPPGPQGPPAPPQNQLPRLPPINLNNVKWDGNLGSLSFYLRNFRDRFAGYGEQATLPLFFDCMGKQYQRGLRSCRTLDQAINYMSQWASDSKIHTTKIVRKLDALVPSKSLQEDKNLARQYIMLLEECMEINDTFFLSIPDVNVYAAKFYYHTLYDRIVEEMHRAAARHHDPHGRQNYAAPFLYCLRNTLKWLDDRLSSEEIFTLTTKTYNYSTFVDGDEQKGNQRGRGRGKGRGNNRGGRGRNGQAGKDNSARDSTHSKCGVCHRQGHANLLYCDKFLLYVPHPTKTWQPLPKSVCKICLNSDTQINSPTCHRSNPSYMCSISKKNNAICQCDDIHTGLQQYLHSNFDPAIGPQNIRIFRQSKNSSSNSINCFVETNHMTLNGCVLGQSSCPAELVEIPLQNGRVFRVELHYDTGSQHSIAAVNINPIVLKTWISSEPMTLSTLAGSSRELRQMCKVQLPANHTLQAICVEHLQIRAKQFRIPKVWKKYVNNWTLQVSEASTNAQILIGTDCPKLHPRDVVVKGKIVCTNTARLQQSMITGKYLAFGYTNDREPSASTNSVHAQPTCTIGPALTCPITDYTLSHQTKIATHTAKVPQTGTHPPQIPSNLPKHSPDAYGVHTILTTDSDTDSSDDTHDPVQVQVHTAQRSGRSPGRVNIKLNLEEAEEFLEKNPDQIVTSQTVTLTPHTI